MRSEIYHRKHKTVSFLLGARPHVRARGLYATVDAQDYERVRAMGTWTPKRDNSSGYVRPQAACETGAHIWLNRFILNARWGTVVLHRDGDGLNNTRENLLLTLSAQGIRSLVR